MTDGAHQSATPVLSVHNLSVTYPAQDGMFHAVNELSFDIAAGEVLGMIGESGAGKSMTGAAITALIDPPGQIVRDGIRLRGERIDQLPDRAMAALRGKRIGSVFQDPLMSLNPLATVGHQLIETIMRHLSLDPVAARQRAVTLLNEVGIGDGERRLGAYPHEFSGGMRQRVVIALAIAADPELLIADEPTSALDVSVQAQIITLLRKLCRERALAVLLITHDMGVVAEIADRVMVLHQGRAVETGSVSQVIGSPRHDYTRKLISATPSLHVRSTRFRSQISRPEILRVDGLSHDFQRRSGGLPAFGRAGTQDRRRVVNDVSFRIGEGETYALVGESGSGKSTIARIIAGLLPLCEGKIRFDGTERRLTSSGGRRDGAIQMVFQDPYASLNPRWRVGNIIAEPIRRLQPETSREHIEGQICELLHRVRLPSDSSQRYPHEFSGGQRQRIAIARALASRPRFIICDEPTSALDVSVQAQVLGLMAELQAEHGLTYLLISHNLAVVRQMADQVGVLSQGTLVEQGPVEEVFQNPRHACTKMLIASVPDVDKALAKRSTSVPVSDLVG